MPRKSTPKSQRVKAGSGHIVYVDMSAKAEQRVLDSAVAVSDGISWVYLIPGSVKLRLQQWLTQKHGRKSIKYRVVATLIYVTICDRLEEIAQLVIDQDYTGTQAHATFKNLLFALLRRDHPPIPTGFIRFEQIKGSRADRLAKQVFDGKRKPDRIVTWAEIERLLEK
jgi:hypothetical protein